jgi:hypothetical protein
MSFFQEYTKGVPYIYKRRAKEFIRYWKPIVNERIQQNTTLTPARYLGYSLTRIVLHPVLANSHSLHSFSIAMTSWSMVKCFLMLPKTISFHCFHNDRATKHTIVSYFLFSCFSTLLDSNHQLLSVLSNCGVGIRNPMRCRHLYHTSWTYGNCMGCPIACSYISYPRSTTCTSNPTSKRSWLSVLHRI